MNHSYKETYEIWRNNISSLMLCSQMWMENIISCLGKKIAQISQEKERIIQNEPCEGHSFAQQLEEKYITSKPIALMHHHHHHLS